MDETDRSIIEFLKEDGRASYTKIADELGVSEGTVRNRVEKLQENGTIEKFTVDINEDDLIEAFVTVELKTDADIQNVLDRLPDDTEVFELAGDIDLLLKIRGERSDEINQQVDYIRAIKGVKSSQTYVVLSSS